MQVRACPSAYIASAIEHRQHSRGPATDPRLARSSLSEIAFSWGFNDASHFSRSFRERHGMSPRDWLATQCLRSAELEN